MPCFHGYGDEALDGRVVVWFVYNEDPQFPDLLGHWGYETKQMGQYGYQSLEQAMKAYISARNTLDAL